MNLVRVRLGHLYHGLEAGVQVGEEGGLPRQGQHPLLHHGALHVVVLDHHVLLQDLDGVQLLCPLPLGQHHLVGEGGRAGREEVKVKLGLDIDTTQVGLRTPTADRPGLEPVQRLSRLFRFHLISKLFVQTLRWVFFVVVVILEVEITAA